jgi:hypothetical protein
VIRPPRLMLVAWLISGCSAPYLRAQWIVADPIQNQVRHEPVELPAAAASLPRHALVTRPYDLSPREFEHLKQFDPVFAAAGGAVLSFALTFGLPLIVRWLVPSDPPGHAPSVQEWWIFGVGFAIGALLLVFGLFAPRQRRAVMKKIDDHFKANPDQLFYKDDLR